MENETNTSNNTIPEATKDELWYLNNYFLLRDYYDRTISRIAARCIRMGNIAIEDYPFFSYTLDVLEEIRDTGEYIMKHRALYPYIEKKIKGGMNAFRANLEEYKQELEKNSSPDMIKEKENEVADAKAILTVADDPTKGAGTNPDDLINELLAKQAAKANNDENK